MRQILSTRNVEIPANVDVSVKARKVRVKGDRGVLTREFKHAAVDMYLIEEDDVKKLRVDASFGKRKSMAVLRTITSHVQNMINGVTKGFEYKMRLVYAHFPININILEDGKRIEIRNFLGEKRVRVVQMLPGVKVEQTKAVKDELVLRGNSIEYVSRSAALIYMQCLVKKKDIRKFLDGIYVSSKGFIENAE